MENRKHELGGTTATHTTNNTTTNNASASTTSSSNAVVATTTTAAAAAAATAASPPGAVNNNNNSSSTNNSCSMALVAVTASQNPAGATTTTATAASTTTGAATTGTTPAITTVAPTPPPTSSSSPSTQTPPVHHHHHHHHHHGHHGHGQGSASGSSFPSLANSTSSSMTSSSSSSTAARTRPAVFDKLEQLVRDMQDDDRGVPVRSQKMFLTSIPAAFMGYDLIEWLMDRLSIEDSLEAVHLANLLCQFGYYFPINELKNLLVKDDSSLYRFQTPYYWPSQHHTPDNIEYAIYLDKRSQRNRQKHGLEDYELDAYNNLKKILANKWEFVMMQADEQLKIAKDRKKGEKIVTDSQEKAYWRVYRPPPGYTTVVESSPVPTREQRSKARSRTREHLTDEYEFLKNYFAMSRTKVSQVAESLIDYTDIFLEYDPVLNPVIPSNPWVADEATYWQINQPLVDVPTEKRVRKWAISLEDLITDPLGLQELLSYMKKEYSHENLRFWLAVQDLRRGPGSEAVIKKHVKEIWDEFLSPGAKAEINIDSQTMELTKQNMKNPTRFTFEEAAGHIFLLLLKKDCYPRFIRSESYKSLLANALKPRNMKKPFFNFPARKKPTTTPVPSGQGGQGSCTIVNTKERMWEEFNIYGAQGGDNSDSPETNTFDRNMCRDINESVCPWDNFAGEGKDRKSPRGSVGSGGGGGSHKRRGSDPTLSTRATGGASGGGGGGTSNPSEGGTSPHHGKHRSHHQSALGDGKTCSGGVTVKSCSATRTSSLENSLERSGSCRRRQTDARGSLQEDGTAGHHHHHHHHHHGHGAGTSRRSKNRSKRKKTSIRSSTLTSAGELAAAIAAAATATATSCTTTTTSTQFNAPPMSSQQQTEQPLHGKGHHQPPHHQHSASSLISSVVAPASLLMVGHSFDRMSSGVPIAIPPLAAISGGSNVVTTSTTSMDSEVAAGGAGSAGAGGGGGGPATTSTSSKCTQTKLEDEDELFNIPTSPTLAKQSPVRGPTSFPVPMNSCKIELPLNTKSQVVHTKDLQLVDDDTDLVESSSVPVTSTVSLPEAALATSPRAEATATATTGGAASTSMLTVTHQKSSDNSNDQAPIGTDSSKGDLVVETGNNHNSVGGAEAVTTATEQEGDTGAWNSSTEVCPWEDEENRRDSHPPFVKTYATLGFL